MQDYRELYQFPAHGTKIVFDLSPNEFIDDQDRLGLIFSDPEPVEFLAVQSPKELDDFPNPSSIKIQLSNLMKQQYRYSYSLMALGGDIGGLYGAVVALPGLILSFYTVRMFHKSVSADLPVKEINKDSSSQMPKSLDKKLASQGTSPATLTFKDV